MSGKKEKKRKAGVEKREEKETKGNGKKRVARGG